MNFIYKINKYQYSHWLSTLEMLEKEPLACLYMLPQEERDINLVSSVIVSIRFFLQSDLFLGRTGLNAQELQEAQEVKSILYFPDLVYMHGLIMDLIVTCDYLFGILLERFRMFESFCDWSDIKLTNEILDESLDLFIKDGLNDGYVFPINVVFTSSITELRISEEEFIVNILRSCLVAYTLLRNPMLVALARKMPLVLVK